MRAYIIIGAYYECVGSRDCDSGYNDVYESLIHLIPEYLSRLSPRVAFLSNCLPGSSLVWGVSLNRGCIRWVGKRVGMRRDRDKTEGGRVKCVCVYQTRAKGQNKSF